MISFLSRLKNQILQYFHLFLISVEQNENDTKLDEMENKQTRNIEQPQPRSSKKTKKFGWKYLHSRKNFLDKNLKRSRTLTMDSETVNENTGNFIFSFLISLLNIFMV